MAEDKFKPLRHQMVEQQLMARGIRDKVVLHSMYTVPRHAFVPVHLQCEAYEDNPLPIGDGQTISQPYIVALMAEAAQIQSTDKILEIGTGSGFSAAVLAQCAAHVYTVERIPALAKAAQLCFRQLGYANIDTKIDDGTLGWAENGPYDAIIVTAGAPAIPQSLLSQLKVGGRMVIPVGDAISQRLCRVRKLSESKTTEEALEYVRFVPLIGQEGW